MIGSEGWVIPPTLYKSHYFRRGKSLCTFAYYRGSYFSDKDESAFGSTGVCQECIKLKVVEETDNDEKTLRLFSLQPKKYSGSEKQVKFGVHK